MGQYNMLRQLHIVPMEDCRKVSKGARRRNNTLRCFRKSDISENGNGTVIGWLSGESR